MNDRLNSWRGTLALMPLKPLETVAPKHRYDIIRLLSSRERVS